MGEIVVSSETLDELRTVLGRERLDPYRDRESRLAFFALYEAMSVKVEPTQTITACRDPKDDKFLSLAVSAGATLLISSDDDLLSMRQIQGVRIILTCPGFSPT